MTAAAAACPFAGLLEGTRLRLAPLGLTPAYVAPEFAAAEGGGGRMRLEAERWVVGPAGDPVADARLVRITGAATEIVNAMIFPARPDAVPVFAAELLSFGRQPRLAFLDLQVPGLASGRVAAVAARTRMLAAQYIDWSSPEIPPDWALHCCSGGFFFSRMSETPAFDAWAAAYQDYLDAWVEFAARPGAPSRRGAAELAEYRRSHVAHTPGRPFLGKLFGPGWADRFLGEFLYGPEVPRDRP